MTSRGFAEGRTSHSDRDRAPLRPQREGEAASVTDTKWMTLLMTMLTATLLEALATTMQEHQLDGLPIVSRFQPSARPRSECDGP